MMMSLTKREEEIAELREKKNLTFKEIGERCHFSASRASQIYAQVRYKRREEQRWELHREQNQKVVSFKLTLGEAVILRRIVVAFQDWKLMNERHTIRRNRDILEAVDDKVAKELAYRLLVLEREERRESQSAKQDG